jgi:hypothetical protein
MARWQVLAGLAVCSVGLGLAAQAPGPLATPTDRLDYLLSTWKGQSVAHVREVFGREKEKTLRGTNVVLVYEKRVKVRPGFGSVIVNPLDGGLRCVVRFEIDDKEKVVRTAHQGGGQVCWDQWRRYEP